ncbi:MAG TPA: hypothetical protein PLI22_01940 [Caldisericia bacterium]|mgnify:CR=1 FL=1|nr:hypothetical protein [Caldisericia bacterium]
MSPKKPHFATYTFSGWESGVKKIKFLTGRPERTHAITEDECLNLKIDLKTLSTKELMKKYFNLEW